MKVQGGSLFARFLLLAVSYTYGANVDPADSCDTVTFIWAFYFAYLDIFLTSIGVVLLVAVKCFIKLLS